MHIELFVLCEAATSEAGKLNILGVFDVIWSQAVPVVYPQCTVALRIRFKNIERGEHSVVVTFVDVDGKPVIPEARGSVQVDFPDAQKSGAANLILNIHNLKLLNYGEYAIDLAIDGRSEGSLPLFVREAGNMSA